MHLLMAIARRFPALHFLESTTLHAMHTSYLLAQYGDKSVYPHHSNIQALGFDPRTSFALGALRDWILSIAR